MQISTLLYEFTLMETVQNHADINSLVSSVDPDQLASEEASWSGSTLFSKKHVNSIINQNMNNNFLLLTLYKFCTCQRTSKLKFSNYPECGSSSRCHEVVCSLWLWYFLIILTYYLWYFRGEKFQTSGIIGALPLHSKEIIKSDV